MFGRGNLKTDLLRKLFLKLTLAKKKKKKSYDKSKLFFVFLGGEGTRVTHCSLRCSGTPHVASWWLENSRQPSYLSPECWDYTYEPSHWAWIRIMVAVTIFSARAWGMLNEHSSLAL